MLVYPKNLLYYHGNIIKNRRNYGRIIIESKKENVCGNASDTQIGGEAH